MSQKERTFEEALAEVMSFQRHTEPNECDLADARELYETGRIE